MVTGLGHQEKKKAFFISKIATMAGKVFHKEKLAFKLSFIISI